MDFKGKELPPAMSSWNAGNDGSNNLFWFDWFVYERPWWLRHVIIIIIEEQC